MTERPDPQVPEVRAATLAQRRAATPDASAWVSANAGSGKTRVLTERVARLLLAGQDPARILCLTYTRAAAAEMANRLSQLLGRWALMPEAALREVLAGLDAEGAPDLSARALSEARRLFAKALETPGGLKIQTIHAFCAAALRRFPLEAGVSPDFAELDEPERDRLVQAALDRLAAAAEAGKDDAFDAVAAHLAEEGLAGLCREILAARGLYRDPPAPAGLCAALGVAEGELGSDPLAAFWAGFDRAAAGRAAAAMAAGGKTDADFAAALAAALGGGGPAALYPAFFTTQDAPRQLGRLPTKAVAAAHPWLPGWIAETAEAYVAAKARADAVAAAERAVALNRFGAAFLGAYEAAKCARGALDFDDLVEHALRLIADPETGPWALWKLDGGIDHLLVDEAQDTSPTQWALIRGLTAEFFAGEGRRTGRTLFVVGDEKQSIYSFQGAEPSLFGENRAAFRTRLDAAGAPLLDLPILTSFRTSPAILSVVDATFAAAPEGLSADGLTPRHGSAWPGRAGRVDLWPLVARDEAAQPPPWDEPLDAPPPGDPRLRLARLVAAEIARWTAGGEPLPGAGRAVRPGDVMVLVRRRDRLAAELVRHLKRLRVPVAGADRIRIAEELAVRDLLAAARFALTPGDDLSLAALLRSPLCGLSEAALFDLAHGREGPLWARVRAAPEHAAAARFLEGLLGRADFLRPFEFLDAILTRDGGRDRLLARLGVEAEDALDELLAQALAYESTHTPSLTGFLDWLDRAGVEIRREQDKGEGTVRVMTVHGSKGLEAPVVILPDTLGARFGRPPATLPLDAGSGRRAAAWRGGRGTNPPAIEAAEALRARRAQEESRRLLYVAMTRAERWLVVAGAGEPAKGETWYGLVEAGLRQRGAVPLPAPQGLPGEMLRVAEGEPGAAAPDRTQAMPPPALPGWARAAPSAPPPAAPRRQASALGGEVGGGAGGTGHGPDPALARRRGTAVHALLEDLPALPASARPAAATRLLARLAAEDAAHHGAWIAEALGVLALPAVQPWLAPDALAEVPLSWDAPGGRIAGRIDRLIVGAASVRAIDFKTDALPPDSAPEPYLRQIAAYRAALGLLYPGREVSVSLLWTATGRLETPDAAALEAALARLSAESQARAPVASRA